MGEEVAQGRTLGCGVAVAGASWVSVGVDPSVGSGEPVAGADVGMGDPAGPGDKRGVGERDGINLSTTAGVGFELGVLSLST